MPSPCEIAWEQPAAMTRRMALVGAASLFAVPAGPASAGERLTEKNMTQKDFLELGKTESSVPGKTKESTPAAVHDLSSANEKALKQAHATKVTKGKRWRKMSAKQRDAELRRLKKLLDPDTILVISIPECDIWAIPDLSTHDKLFRDRTLRRWDLVELLNLPRAVSRPPSSSQSDRHGTSVGRRVEPQRD